MSNIPTRLLRPDVRITPHHFSMLRVTVGLAMAAFFIGMHVGYSRMHVDIPLSIPHGGELLDRIDTYVLAANASTIFCITGVAASLLLSLGYFRRILAVVVLFRLGVILYGHWLQMVSGILPAVLLLFIFAIPSGAPWELLRKRKRLWSVPAGTANLFWVACSMGTLVFVWCALGKQLHLLSFQKQAADVAAGKAALIRVFMVFTLLANLFLPWRPRSRAVLWGLNLLTALFLGILWYNDRLLGLMPRVWQPWAMSTSFLYIVIWFLLFDGGLMAGRSPTAGTRRLVLFDGLCGLCNGAVRFLLDEDVDKVLSFSTLQGETAEKNVVSSDGDTIMYVREHGSENPEVLTYSNAALAIARDIGGFIGFLATIAIIVPRPLRDLVYKAVAKVRYRVFGKYDECPLPTEEDRSRFLP